MSETHGQPGGHGVRQEEDRIAPVPIVAVGVASLVLFFLASWVTIGFLRAKEGERPPLPVPAEIGSSKIGLVEQQLFERATRGESDRAARRERLRSYGWVDRSAGIVRIPIERAMDLTAQGVRPAGAPRGPTPGGQP